VIIKYDGTAVDPPDDVLYLCRGGASCSAQRSAQTRSCPDRQPALLDREPPVLSRLVYQSSHGEQGLLPGCSAAVAHGFTQGEYG